MKNLCKLSIYRGFLEKLRSEANAINFNRNKFILILIILYINRLCTPSENCGKIIFEEILRLPYKCRTNFISLQRD